MYEMGKTVQVAQEMRNYNISLVGLCGKMVLYSGHTKEGAPHTEGVALMLTPEAQRSLIGREPVNSWIITAKFATEKDNIILNIIQCYTPTNDAEEEKKTISMTNYSQC